MIGLRVRQVREVLGWSQTELAKRASIGQARISEVEAGHVANDDFIDAVARATGFPATWFELPDATEFPEGTIRYRKTSRASKTDDRRAIRRLEIASELVERLGDGFALPPVSVPFFGDGDVDTAAATTREAFNEPDRGPVRNVVRTAERAGAIVVALPVDLGTNTDVRNHHGVSAWPDLAQRPLIGFSTADPGDRQRHTVTHELGHLVLHRGETEHGRDYEREASRFAGAFLMPHADALDAFDRGITIRRLGQLKASWGISIAGLIVRARQVGAIDEARQVSLFKQLSARGWRKSEPVTVHREQPALIARLVGERFGEPPDWRAVGKYVSLPPHLVREITEAGTPDLVLDDVPVDAVRLQPRA